MKKNVLLSAIVRANGIDKDSVLSLVELTNNSEGIRSFVSDMFAAQNNDRLYIAGKSSVYHQEIGTMQNLRTPPIEDVVLACNDSRVGRGNIFNPSDSLSVAFSLGYQHSDSVNILNLQGKNTVDENILKCTSREDDMILVLSRHEPTMSYKLLGNTNIMFSKHNKVYGIVMADRNTCTYLENRKMYSKLEKLGFELEEVSSGAIEKFKPSWYIARHREKGIILYMGAVDDFSVSMSIGLVEHTMGNIYSKLSETLEMEPAQSPRKEYAKRKWYKFPGRKDDLFPNVNMILYAYEHARKEKVK